MSSKWVFGAKSYAHSIVFDVCCSYRCHEPNDTKATSFFSLLLYLAAFCSVPGMESASCGSSTGNPLLFVQGLLGVTARGGRRQALGSFGYVKYFRVGCAQSYLNYPADIFKSVWFYGFGLLLQKV